MMLRIKYIIPLIILLVSLLFTGAVAQQDAKKFFIYIQNENGSPFYVKETNNKVLSSAHAGYIIIPQLSKGNYDFTIGLPGDQVAEAAFEIHLDGKGDQGLLLREGNGQLALYSLKDLKEIQPMAVASAPGNRIVNVPSPPPPVNAGQQPAEQQPAEPVAVNQPETSAAPRKDTGGTDTFSKMLDKIMGTTKKPAVTTTAPQNPPAVNTDSEQNVFPIKQTSNHADTTQNVINTGNTVTNNNVTGNPPPSSPPSSQNNGLQFINFLSDSIKASPAPQPKISANNAAPAALPVSSQPKEAALPNVNSDSASQMVMGNSDCRQLTSEDFFQKLRRKMASRSDDEGILRIAQKYLSGGTCFSTQQIQSLTYLFSTDEYKYKFLELAYPHAYDSQHFPSLIKTLGNDYYRGRFKAMVR